MTERMQRKLKRVIKTLEIIREDWDTSGRDRAELAQLVIMVKQILKWNKKGATNGKH